MLGQAAHEEPIPHASPTCDQQRNLVEARYMRVARRSSDLIVRCRPTAGAARWSPFKLFGGPALTKAGLERFGCQTEAYLHVIPRCFL
jgi:hypothetical protein